MRQMFEARQPQKAASAFDRVEQTKNPDDRFVIRRIAFEQDQLLAGGLDMLACLDKKIVEQVVHLCAKSPAEDKPGPELSRKMG
jgi:hypothetical protein